MSGKKEKGTVRKMKTYSGRDLKEGRGQEGRLMDIIGCSADKISAAAGGNRSLATGGGDPYI